MNWPKMNYSSWPNDEFGRDEKLRIDKNKSEMTSIR